MVTTEFEILLNPRFVEDRQLAFLGDSMQEVQVPSGHRLGVDESVYLGYRRGLDSACADIVITSRNVHGEPVVLLTRRAKAPFNGVWWVQGGAIHAYRSIIEFVKERAKRECGVEPLIETLIGIYRTCAEDGVASTLNLCYCGRIFRADLERSRPVADRDHSTWKLFTLSEYNALPSTECHPYIDRVVRLCLTSMP